MFQRLRDAHLLIRLGRVRRLEAKHDYVGALAALEAIDYKGPYAGFLATYTTRMMAMARDGRTFQYVNIVRRFLRHETGDLRYRSYCLAYCKYLRRVFEGYPYELAAAEVLSQPSTALIRNALPVTVAPVTGWQRVNSDMTVGV